MPEVPTQNFLVYRDGKRRVRAETCVRQLEDTVASPSFRRGRDSLISALISAGELESALSDADFDDATFAAAVTDHLAESALRADEGLEYRLPVNECLRLLSRIKPHGELTVSIPEGFAYYALHPLDFADTVSCVPLDMPSALVIGIRSIGTTLSAVSAAKLKSIGVAVERTTVRPWGHPYERKTTLTPAQRAQVRVALSHGAAFMVCDEGPGRSGSSLLSVAEVLEQEGVRPEHIILLCSHEPDVDSLCAPRAAERWRRYRSIAAGLTRRLPGDAGRYVGGGEWRNLLIPQGSPWPAVWPQMESLKFLSRDGRGFIKFQGHGSYGQRVRQRHEMLAESGFGEAYLGQESGFGVHQVVKGISPRHHDVSPALLRHFAKYCAWRTTAFASSASECDLHKLEEMTGINVEQEMGFTPELHLELARPAICDGRMQPYKWVAAAEDRWLKLDAATHGDDHFFPGPTDIAWDLAGLCIEWELGAEARDFLIAEYVRISSDRPAARLPDYELAYAAFRLGWSRMAASSVAGSVEEERLLRAARFYRNAMTHLQTPPVLA